MSQVDDCNERKLNELTENTPIVKYPRVQEIYDGIK